MDQSNLEILYSINEINNNIKRVANNINKDYSSDEDLIFICLLKGGFIFTSDLIRYVNKNVNIDFMVVSSYGNNEESSGVVKIKKNIEIDIKDKNVILVDDIIDTGTTLYEIKKILEKMNPKSIKTCCLLNKVSRREMKVDVDYYCFECPNEFVLGYGMDSGEYYRNLPYIGYVTSKKPNRL